MNVTVSHNTVTGAQSCVRIKSCAGYGGMVDVSYLINDASAVQYAIYIDEDYECTPSDGPDPSIHLHVAHLRASSLAAGSMFCLASSPCILRLDDVIVHAPLAWACQNVILNATDVLPLVQC